METIIKWIQENPMDEFTLSRRELVILSPTPSGHKRHISIYAEGDNVYCEVVYPFTRTTGKELLALHQMVLEFTEYAGKLEVVYETSK